jgi:hypothetical protein
MSLSLTTFMTILPLLDWRSWKRRELRACPEISESTYDRVKYGFTTV